MLKKLFPIMLVAFFITACEAPMDDAGTTNGAVTDGTGTDGTGYNNGGVGSELQGAGESELAPGVRDTVYFQLDSSSIDGDAQRVLDQQAAYLKSSGTRVLVEGHCDERGTREYNLALGERRANAIKQYLVAQGVDAGSVETISYGKERPIAEGSNEDAWQRNRRGVTVKR
jgi:peptidoglycan-associated lipoprotein